MDFVTNDVDDENIVFGHSSSSNDRNVLRVVVTEASTEIALALMYRILSNKIFDDDQLIYLIAYETFEKALFLESVVIELTEFSSDQLDGIIWTHEPSVAFKNADIVFCIGLARGYEFINEENEDTFFEECSLASKFHGEIIERYAKKDVKVIVLGNIAATIISHYAKSIPRKNVTALSNFNMKICAAHIAARTGCRVDQIKNIIVWGTNNKLTFPDCRYVCFNKDVIINDCLHIWLKIDLPQGLLDDNSYVQRQIEKLSETLTSKVRAALQICNTE
ncbi:malate dehydrogenase, cytoplasmic-like [Polistes fuscatus]|uniref:malate dehydrogenase, cytoplasmic-like n=1 Tax=Polistes fuscatus TaxID=30207 RepID=UPI001CA97E66|nr:malate dehydrogenase, cytoplasmic-like [Polistes fuscatus]